MQNQPKISIIIPIWNTEKYLRKCLASVVNQTYTNLEIICINNGSTDSCADIIKEFAANDKRIKTIYQEHTSLGEARNRGLDSATGDYITFVDSDDWLDTEALKEVLDRMEKWRINQTPVDMLVCNYIYDHLYEGRQQQIHYRNVFESGSPVILSLSSG